jgi:hypothetical protein
MATIVTVHGTFSTGPLEGQKWWQLKSVFATRLPELIEGTDGSLAIEPFVWDGLNSEMSRRAAGARLAARLTELEAKGEPYAVVGHSHGGSVVSTALLNSARAREPLSHMQRWITVGTPFIKTQRQRFLFSRLGVLGKAIYLTLLTLLVLGVLISLTGSISPDLVSWIMVACTFLGPLALFYAILRYQEARRSLRFNRKHLGFAERNFADRWLSLWHAKDEAVQCLKAVKSLDVTIFPRNFAASTLNLLAIAIIPLMCVLVLTSKPTMDAIADRVFTVLEAESKESIYPSAGADISENAAVLFIGMIVLPVHLVAPGLAFDELSYPAQIGLLVLVVVMLIAAAFLLTLIFSELARIVSHGLSLLLNPMTLTQLKRVTYGSDTQEEFATDASEWPTWLKHGYPPLPLAVAYGIEQASDYAIGSAIPKFRNIIDSLTAADTAEATSNVIAEYLTWRELIHTSYFDQEGFVKLIAFALCHTQGFRPTAAFAEDPDIPTLVEIYDEITSGAKPAPLPAGARDGAIFPPGAAAGA